VMFQTRQMFPMAAHFTRVVREKSAMFVKMNPRIPTVMEFIPSVATCNETNTRLIGLNHPQTNHNTMRIHPVKTSRAPTYEDNPWSFDEPPWSQAIIHDNTVYVSGKVGIDPETGEVVSDELEAQSVQAFENVGAILREAGTSWDNAIKVTLYLTDSTDFDNVSRIYNEFISKPYPARTTVEVDLQRGFLVDVDVIAALPEAEPRP